MLNNLRPTEEYPGLVEAYNLSLCFVYFLHWISRPVSPRRSSRDRERSSRDRSRERDRRDGMNGRSDSRRAGDRDAGDLWRPNSIHHDTTTSCCLSLTCLSIYNNLTSHTHTHSPCLDPSVLPPASFLCFNAADPGCTHTWHIVWIKYSSIQIYQIAFGWGELVIDQ